jgi:tetratricopeptide (TPR) repeat protein
VLQSETNDTSKVRYLALFMRGKAYLNTDRLDEAQRDYEVLQKALPTEYPVNYDLGEIAYRRKDTKMAVEQYRRYLANAPTNLTEDIRFVNDRLQKLKQTSP